MKNFTKNIVIIGLTTVLFAGTLTACKGTSTKGTSEQTTTSGEVEIITMITDENGEWQLPDSNEMTGGWNYEYSDKITDEVRAKFDKAFEGFTGATYVPVAYIGSQIVAGTNHAILCEVTPVVAAENVETTYAIVYIYEDLEGNCEILDIQNLELGVQ